MRWGPASDVYAFGVSDCYNVLAKTFNFEPYRIMPDVIGQSTTYHRLCWDAWNWSGRRISNSVFGRKTDSASVAE